MHKNPFWANVPLQWGLVPEQFLSGKKLKQMIEAYRYRTIELAVDWDCTIKWRRFVDDPNLELGL